MRSRTVSLGILSLLLGASMAATPSVDNASMDGVVPVGDSSVQVAVEDVAGLDRIEAWASTAGSSVNVTPGTPRSCVSAQRSEIRTEDRNGTATEVKVIQTEDGCTTPTTYSFDRVTWQATTIADVPTTVTTEIYERGATGWHLVEDHREPSTATIDLTWQGTAVEAVEPWVDWPNICLSNPPKPCYYGAGVDLVRGALVEGSVSLDGLSADAELSAPGQPGTMRWWLSAWWVTVP